MGNQNQNQIRVEQSSVCEVEQKHNRVTIASQIVSQLDIDIYIYVGRQVGWRPTIPRRVQYHFGIWRSDSWPPLSFVPGTGTVHSNVSCSVSPDLLPYRWISGMMHHRQYRCHRCSAHYRSCCHRIPDRNRSRSIYLNRNHSCCSPMWWTSWRRLRCDAHDP